MQEIKKLKASNVKRIQSVDYGLQEYKDYDEEEDYYYQMIYNYGFTERLPDFTGDNYEELLYI